MSDDSVVIVGGARTPMGSMNGVLSAVTAVELGTTAIKAALQKTAVPADAVDEVYMGTVLQAGCGQGPARIAALEAGLPNHVGAMSLNKLCGSGMHTIILGHDQIKAGSADVVVAGGMESMTNAPHMIMGARQGVGTGSKALEDHMFKDALWSAAGNRLMGCYAQDVADELNITRADMDEYAIASLTRAKAAIEDGTLDGEVVPVTIKTRRGETQVTQDEQPMTAKLDKIPNLKPAFSKDGTVTAANSSSISDGASAIVIMRESKAKSLGCTPIARILGHTRQSQEPDRFTLAPIGAMEKLLKKMGWTVDDVDLFEVNEAFAMVPMAAMRALNIDHAKLNVHGGACAQGHPVGSSGSRIVLTLMNALKRQGKKRGVASICIGGGEALAMAIEII